MLKADKSLVWGLYNIIDKYLPELFIMFDNLTDARQKGKVTYSMKVICVTRLFGLLCGITSMNSLTNKFNNNFTIDTLSKITKTNLSELPHCDNCLVKKHSDGGITYEHQVLEAKLVFDSFVLSIDSEFIENPNHDVVQIKKQDCEMNAFKRMAVRLKKNFPKLKFIITADSLYASGPFIKICLDNKWDYIFRLKSDKLRTVNQDFDGIISINSGTKHKNYFLVSDYKYIIELGRRRWKIENQGFNIQKNNIFDITHMCSLNYNAMKAHYLFTQFAHTIRQLFDLGSSFVIPFQGKIKEISFAILNELISNTIKLIENKNFQLRFDKLII